MPHSQVDVEKTIVIDIAEVCPHGHKNFIQANLGGYVFKCAVVEIAVQFQRFGGERKPKIAADDFLH